MVTEPQPSVAVAAPVALVRVSPGHWSTRFAGSLSAGGVVSTTVMLWRALALLPHWSVAVQVRAITLVPPQLLLTESLKLIVTEPQPSGAVAGPVALVRVWPGHWSTRLVGGVRAGGVVSRTVMVWRPLRLLPHWSVAVQVRAMTLAPPQLLLTTSV